MDVSSRTNRAREYGTESGDASPSLPPNTGKEENLSDIPDVEIEDTNVASEGNRWVGYGRTQDTASPVRTAPIRHRSTFRPWESKTQTTLDYNSDSDTLTMDAGEEEPSTVDDVEENRPSSTIAECEEVRSKPPHVAQKTMDMTQVRTLVGEEAWTALQQHMGGTSSLHLVDDSYSPPLRKRERLHSLQLSNSCPKPPSTIHHHSSESVRRLLDRAADEVGTGVSSSISADDCAVPVEVDEQTVRSSLPTSSDVETRPSVDVSRVRGRSYGSHPFLTQRCSDRMYPLPAQPYSRSVPPLVAHPYAIGATPIPTLPYPSSVPTVFPHPYFGAVNFPTHPYYGLGATPYLGTHLPPLGYPPAMFPTLGGFTPSRAQLDELNRPAKAENIHRHHSGRMGPADMSDTRDHTHEPDSTSLSTTFSAPSLHPAVCSEQDLTAQSSTRCAIDSCSAAKPLCAHAKSQIAPPNKSLPLQREHVSGVAGYVPRSTRSSQVTLPGMSTLGDATASPQDSLQSLAHRNMFMPMPTPSLFLPRLSAPTAAVGSDKPKKPKTTRKRRARIRGDSQTPDRESAIRECDKFCEAAGYLDVVVLPVLGGRDRKWWFSCKDTSSNRYIASVTQIPNSVISHVSKHAKDITSLAKLFQSETNIFVLNLSALAFSEDCKYLVAVFPYFRNGSLLDKMHHVNPNNDWFHKYGMVSEYQLSPMFLRLFAAQMLHSLHYLLINRINLSSHVHCGNIFETSGGWLKAGGYLEALCGFPPREVLDLWKYDLHSHQFPIIRYCLNLFTIYRDTACMGATLTEMMDFITDRHEEVRIPEFKEFLSYVMREARSATREIPNTLRIIADHTYVKGNMVTMTTVPILSPPQRDIAAKITKCWRLTPGV